MIIKINSDMLFIGRVGYKYSKITIQRQVQEDFVDAEEYDQDIYDLNHFLCDQVGIRERDIETHTDYNPDIVI